VSVIRRALCIGLLAVSLVACRSKTPAPPPPPKPLPPTLATLTVSADANPDNEGRPSPIVIRIYQLKEGGAFTNANYFALVDKESEALGSSLVSREEYEMQPGATRELELQIPAEARVLGVIAGYRDINNSRWKAVANAPEAGLADFVRKHKPTIAVGQTTVTIVTAK
jgi:type VI secretion system protein VasD